MASPSIIEPLLGPTRKWQGRLRSSIVFHAVQEFAWAHVFGITACRLDSQRFGFAVIHPVKIATRPWDMRM